MKNAIRLSGSLICIVFLFLLVVPFIQNNNRIPDAVPYVLVLAMVGATAGICFGLRKIIQKHLFRIENVTSRFIMQCVLLMGVITVFFMLRIPEMQRIAVEMISATEYYQMAAIGGSGIDYSMNVSQTAYTNLNSFVFLFLGNKAILMPMIQMLCQLILLVCLFCANNCLNGFIAGTVPALVVAVSPVFTTGVQSINPHCFTAMLFGIWFLIFAFAVKNEDTGRLNFAKLIGLGLATGYFSYIWFFAIAGVVMTWFYIAMKKDYNAKQKMIDFLVYTVASVGTFALIALVSTGNAAYIFVDYNKVSLLEEMGQYILPHGILTFGGILLAVSGFWNKESNSALLFVPFACVVGAYFTGFGFGESASFSMLYQVTMGLIAGAGLQQIFSVEESAAFVTEMKKEYEGVNNGLLAVEHKDLGKNPVPVPAQNLTQKAPETSPSPQKPKVELIENPLPLPKKHERRTLEYGFEPRPEQMHYDVELTSRNCFYDIN